VLSSVIAETTGHHGVSANSTLLTICPFLTADLMVLLITADSDEFPMNFWKRWPGNEHEHKKLTAQMNFWEVHLLQWTRPTLVNKSERKRA